MIGQARKDRLWKHLMMVEKQVGAPLRLTPRGHYDMCPIRNFAPDENGRGEKFSSALASLFYGPLAWESYTPVYEVEDTDWWEALSYTTKKQVTRWVSRKLKER